MGTKSLLEMPLHKKILQAMDGRRNNWLVEKTGIDAPQVSRILNGLTPTVSQLEKINIALSTDFTLNG